jgi:hypothetical protein
MVYTVDDIFDQTDALGRPIDEDTGVCRHCGSTDLRTIEKATGWARAIFTRTGTYYTPDWAEMDFDAPETDWTTAGYACDECYSEELTEDVIDEPLIISVREYLDNRGETPDMRRKPPMLATPRGTWA